MKELRLIIEREFKARVSKRAYAVFTILGIVLMIGLVFLPSIMNWVQDKASSTIAVRDPNGIVTQGLKQATAQDSSALGFKLVFAGPSATTSTSTDDVKAYLKQVGAKALVDVRGTSAVDASVVIEQAKDLDPSQAAMLENLVQSQIVQRRIVSLDATTQQQIGKPVDIQVISLSQGGKSSEALMESKMLVYCMEILLMMTLVLYGTWVAQGLIEEKSNRIVELLLVSAKPWHILFGKVLGVGLVGLVQYAVWIASVVIAMTVGNTSGGLKLESVPVSTLAWFPVFFVLGYLFYATLFGIGGSLVYRAEEQQMAITPVTLLMVVSFYAGIAVLINPDSTFAVIVSLIPFCAPLGMFARIAVSTVPVWQVLVSLVLLGLFIWLAIVAGEKVYRKYALRTSGSAGWKILFQNRSKLNRM